MVRGLDTFRSWFAGYRDQYILIGGTAATITMEGVGLDFRATKDLDVVLVVEALTPAFGATFWDFIKAGGYEIRQASDTGKPTFYRFQKPADPSFPAMVELFARTPDSLRPIAAGQLTPIPFDEAISSLSAILLDDEYYAFVMAGRREADGLSWIGEDRLIPLKASAWLDLRERKAQGESIDSRNVSKHANDVVRLSQVLTEANRIDLPSRIADDLRRFLAAIREDGTINPRDLGLGRLSLAEVLDRVARAYGLI